MQYCPHDLLDNPSLKYSRSSSIVVSNLQGNVQIVSGITMHRRRYIVAKIASSARSLTISLTKSLLNKMVTIRPYNLVHIASLL